MRRIDEEEADRRILAGSGAAGFVAQVAAGVVDPTLALPGGILVRSGRLGYSVSRSALSVGLAAGTRTARSKEFQQAAPRDPHRGRVGYLHRIGRHPGRPDRRRCGRGCGGSARPLGYEREIEFRLP